MVTDPEDVRDAKISETVSYTCLVESSITPSYQWFKDSEMIEENQEISGVDTQQLVISSINVRHRGFYSCVATTIKGCTTSMSAILNIKGTCS